MNDPQGIEVVKELRRHHHHHGEGEGEDHLDKKLDEHQKEGAAAAAAATTTTTTTTATTVTLARSWIFEKAPTIMGGLTTPKKQDLSLLTKLDLPNCNLTSFPESFHLAVPNLSILFCPKNKFSEIPAEIGLCPKLQMVSFKECHTITSIHPDALQPQLRWLILTGNLISNIPDTISRCTKLQKWMLSGNKLTSLPTREVMRSLTNLELVRLACNDLTEPPTSLLKLPNLRWAAFASNPFLPHSSNNNNATTTNADVDVDESVDSKLQILDDPSLEDTSWPVLGQGAGGVTRKVSGWTTTSSSRKRKHVSGGDEKDEDEDDKTEESVAVDVAAKMYAGELTSDGSPQDEKMIATRLATAFPDEPAMIHVYGETKTKGGLVMEFLEGYEALAGPPSFDTCSRDVYDLTDHCKLLLMTPSYCWKIATSMLRVLTELHKLGICHGDFYAHNILIKPSTQDVKLSDFGAAFCYHKDEPYGKFIERTEVRSFEVLVNELYTNYVVGQNEGDNKKWQMLMKECEKDDATFESLCKQFVDVDADGSN
mmetsp:Transcript_12588/g.30475  ORF Transcript_12588/g.30475 Transcript_12588/m.30475 type:complete len:540 (+) Transcript_12588:150-1769(+)